jgi:hypothetical protein
MRVHNFAVSQDLLEGRRNGLHSPEPSDIGHQRARWDSSSARGFPCFEDHTK